MLYLSGQPLHVDGLVQDCSISIANTLEIFQSCTMSSICKFQRDRMTKGLFTDRD